MEVAKVQMIQRRILRTMSWPQHGSRGPVMMTSGKVTVRRTAAGVTVGPTMPAGTNIKKQQSTSHSGKKRKAGKKARTKTNGQVGMSGPAEICSCNWVRILIQQQRVLIMRSHEEAFASCSTIRPMSGHESVGNRTKFVCKGTHAERAAWIEVDDRSAAQKKQR